VKILKISCEDSSRLNENFQSNSNEIIALNNQLQKPEFAPSFFSKAEKIEPLFELIKEHDGKFKWYSGRYVGGCSIKLPGKKTPVEVKITPRFHEDVINFLLTSIILGFSFESGSEIKHDNNPILKRYLSFIWLQYLQKATRYGFPKKKYEQIQKSHYIKGRLDVNRTIRTFQTEKKAISVIHERATDETILEIIYQAYRILFSTSFDTIKKSNSLSQTVDFINSYKFEKRKIPMKEYAAIKYQRLFRAYKPLIDLSWQIIQNKGIFYNIGQKDGYAYFLDMADVWESFLAEVLKKNFSNDWIIKRPKDISVYPQAFYNRSIRPDIIMINKETQKIIVFDAKWKRMAFDKNDLDRGDFFQIHTYAKYYGKHLIAAGLIYPANSDTDQMNLYKDMIGSENGQMFFAEYINLGTQNGQNGATKEIIKSGVDSFLIRFKDNITII
jgi:5-methylcytosine-specific restriction enzyme subunit McrC